MCGLAGFYAVDGPMPEHPSSVLERMGHTIRHRGPDDSGIWLEESLGIGLSHRRLAIQDLSPLGRQPMTSASGRFVIAFNGEIYNFRRIAKDLEVRGVRFRGHSDTEVLLEAVEAWGLEEALDRCSGMFALALVDRAQRTVSLARDRMGEKPLYYGWLGKLLVFGSQLRALEAVPGWSASLDPEAVCLLLRHNYIPAPWTIYDNVRKLPPAAMLTVGADALRHSPVPAPYWRLPDSEPHAARGGPRDAEHMIERLEATLEEVVADQMISDRPLGAFLSGGVDSSLVVALMQEAGSAPVKTFTIGFTDSRFNEARHASQVAKHLGTDHYEQYVEPDAGLDLMTELFDHYDEPYADSSQIPTMLVSKLAREHVTVALSGDGGDEHFAGYDRYREAIRKWNRIGWMPAAWRKALASGLTRLDRPRTDRLLMPLLEASSRRFRGRSVATFARYAAMRLAARSLPNMYMDDVQIWRRPAAFVNGLQDEPELCLPQLDALSPVRKLMAVDVATYLPDDILVKVDRATMHVGLEGRAPLLDRRVVEAAWALPAPLLQRDGRGKWPLRQLLYKRVPRALVDRPKAGFAVPLAAWLRGPLRPWAESLLSESSLRDLGMLDVAEVRRRWRQHVEGVWDNSSHMWCVLMLSEWARRRRSGGAEAGSEGAHATTVIGAGSAS